MILYKVVIVFYSPIAELAIKQAALRICPIATGIPPIGDSWQEELDQALF